jgi:hypothetical protein
MSGNLKTIYSAAATWEWLAGMEKRSAAPHHCWPCTNSESSLTQERANCGNGKKGAIAVKHPSYLV